MSSEDPMRLMATLKQATFGPLVSKHTVNNLLDDPGVMGIVVGSRHIRGCRELEEQLRHKAFHDREQSAQALCCRVLLPPQQLQAPKRRPPPRGGGPATDPPRLRGPKRHPHLWHRKY
jgi:hypothetical protein